MRERMKNLTVVLLLAAAVLTLPTPVHAKEPGRTEPGRGWMVQLLGWLGLPTLGSVREADSAYIDPNGQPTLHQGGEPEASASSDSSAYIDPNG